MDRAPRHHVMVDFQQHQQRMWAVLEEDHEKVEKRVAELEALLREMLKAYDDGVGREDEHGNNWEFPLWQKVHAALAGQLPAAEHPFAKRLREAGPQIAAEVDRMMAATPSEDGREAFEGAASALLYYLNQTAISDEYVVPETQTAWELWQACCLLHRAALTPAAVVMPERRKSTDPIGYWREKGFNAALDEVARLNRRAIPVEVLRLICADWENGEDVTDYRANAVYELRALLGKDGEVGNG